MNSKRTTLAWMRKILFIVFVVTSLGLSAELVLVGHFEDFWQWIPLLLLCIGVIILLLHSVIGRRINLRIFQIIMLGFILSGIIGLGLHYNAKMEFKLEIDPSLHGFNLFVQTIRGATLPPILAPGIMIQLGCIGLMYTYKHPSLEDVSFYQ